tara:strand:+ start:283202 stop:283369 length:168 start_codon:yes stop_codon:yes gene_type:complete
MEIKYAANNGFIKWLGLGFSFGKTSMIRNFVLFLLRSVTIKATETKPQKISNKKR